MSLRPLLEGPVGRVAPLGVRFWDAVTEAPVGEGLDVRAYPSMRQSLFEKDIE